MNVTPPSASSSAASRTRAVAASPDQRFTAPAPKPAFGVRIADIAALKEDGSIVIGQRKIPTLPQFDQAFGAFAQGTLLQSDCGFVAVEDLQPGDRLMTASGRTEVITWIGAATFAPRDHGERMRLIRVMADSFGLNRPDNFVSLGSAARLLQTPPDLRGSDDTAPMMTPARRFVDGVNVIDVAPPTPVRLFHVAMRRHSAIIAGGLQVESYHPGPNPLHMLSQTLGTVFMSCFPHITQLPDFGPMRYRRAPEDSSQSAA